MAARYDVLVKVVSQKGNCTQGHKVGDEWVLGRKTPDGICLSAFNSLFPNIRMLTYGGIAPWATDPDVVSSACPDANNPVVFEMRRLRE